MSVDNAAPEYPEHLNPFRRRRNTLTRSFRGIKNAIVRSLTGKESKEKEKPVLRPKQQGNEAPKARAIFSMPPSYNREPEVAFPRSRFSERVSKTIRKKSISEDAGQNPFDSEEVDDKDNKKDDSTLLIPPKPAIRSKHKRRKKQAPIPPGSSVGGSKWSLASAESDMSSMGCYSETDVDYIDRSVGDTEEILNLTREIVKFAEDTNNNNISDDAVDEAPKIDEAKPDEVDSENNLKVIVTNEDGVDTDEVVLRKDAAITEDDGETRIGEDACEAAERRISVKGAIDFFEGASSSPSPKVRKNILTKENLLGSEGV